MTEIRTGQAPAASTRAQFRERFNGRFYDPAFEAERDAIARLEAIAWEAVQEGRKATITRVAGEGFSDPAYEVSVQWLETRMRLQAAQQRWSDSAASSRVLLIWGSARNDGTCPSEVSKTWRLTEMAQQVVEGGGMLADVLDLSLVASEYGRNIHPCKGRVLQCPGRRTSSRTYAPTSTASAQHAAVRCGADDRQGLEQRCRYITRPAPANERVQTNAAGQVVLELETPWRDGTTHIVMSPLEFMQRLAALVPRPRLHLIRLVSA